MTTDVFCKIIQGELPADKVAEGHNWIAIKDIRPSAPVHILIIPKKHVAYLEDAQENDKELLGELLLAVDEVAHKVGLSAGGYRIAINQKSDGGQVVPHLHFHLLGGRRLPNLHENKATLLNK